MFVFYNASPTLAHALIDHAETCVSRCNFGVFLRKVLRRNTEDVHELAYKLQTYPIAYSWRRANHNIYVAKFAVTANLETSRSERKAIPETRSIVDAFSRIRLYGRPVEPDFYYKISVSPDSFTSLSKSLKIWLFFQRSSFKTFTGFLLFPKNIVRGNSLSSFIFSALFYLRHRL